MATKRQKLEAEKRLLDKKISSVEEELFKKTNGEILTLRNQINKIKNDPTKTKERASKEKEIDKAFKKKARLEAKVISLHNRRKKVEIRLSRVID